MKRILFISSNIHTPWGGSELLWYKTAVFLKTKIVDVDVAVIARKWPRIPRHIQEIATAGAQIHDLPMPATTPATYVRAKFCRTVEKQKKRLIQKIAPDLILHSMGKSFEGNDWMQIAYELGLPYINLIHLASELQWPGNGEVDLYRAGRSEERRVGKEC